MVRSGQNRVKTAPHGAFRTKQGNNRSTWCVQDKTGSKPLNGTKLGSKPPNRVRSGQHKNQNRITGYIRDKTRFKTTQKAAFRQHKVLHHSTGCVQDKTLFKTVQYCALRAKHGSKSLNRVCTGQNWVQKLLNRVRSG